ncbi:MAG TPA: dihydropteroate synthase [Candidatus Cloacimonadota bacterium]|nr:dihydropteroate synthase [Candidatus Cloacimonadota bacterium]
MHYTIDIRNLNQAKTALKQIEVTEAGIDLMADKMLHINIKMKDVKLAAANILKQEMLSLGADAAVAKGVVTGKAEYSDVILSGSLNQFNKLSHKLEKQSWFGLSEIRQSIIDIMQAFQSENQGIMKIRDKTFEKNKTWLMGILNVTPDSFSDGNLFNTPKKALDHCIEMIKQGVDIIDIGGESSRPGSDPLNEDDEIQRVIPVIETIRKVSDIPISVDTYHAETARLSIEAGADIINDISALRFDQKMTDVLKTQPHIPIILMHMQGMPKTMQNEPFYHDVIADILSFFDERISYCKAHGIEKHRIILDPGIGFGKRLEDNLMILNQLSAFSSFGCPVLLGASRKSFINQIYPSLPQERLMGSLSTSALAFQHGINFVRVHDVKAHREFLSVLQSVREGL